MPLIAIIGIVLGGVGLVVCIITLAFCISWKREKNQVDSRNKGFWKNVPTSPEEEDAELVNDYD